MSSHYDEFQLFEVCGRHEVVSTGPRQFADKTIQAAPIKTVYVMDLEPRFSKGLDDEENGLLRYKMMTRMKHNVYTPLLVYTDRTHRRNPVERSNEIADVDTF